MVSNDEQIVTQLTQACAGLFYMSEADYPFEVIRWDGQTELTPEFLRSLTNESADCQIQEIDVAKLLRPAQYRELLTLLKARLPGAKAYKVGLINMPLYVVGRSPEGNWLGVSTRAVET